MAFFVNPVDPDVIIGTTSVKSRSSIMITMPQRNISLAWAIWDFDPDLAQVFQPLGNFYQEGASGVSAELGQFLSRQY